MAGIVMSLADLARAAATASGPLAPPVKATGPLDAATAREIVEIGKADIKRRFVTGTAPDGSKWKPLRHARPTGGCNPLQNTGRLMASIQGRASPAAVSWFTNHPGAAAHNYGATIVPVRAKFLCLALSREAVRAGSPRRMPGRGTKEMPLFARVVNGRMVGHWLLVKKVTVPRREFMGLSPAARGAITAVLFERAGRAWQRAS